MPIQPESQALKRLQVVSFAAYHIKKQPLDIYPEAVSI